MLGYSNSSTIPGTTGDIGTAVAGAGSNALQSALSGLQGYTPQGNTQSNIDAATAYANNPAIDGQIQAAMRDAQRSVSEQVLPQLARSEALSGNTMSTKNAISQGIVERGLADQTADTSANIRSQAYNTGLQLAENGRQADNSNILQSLLGTASAGTGAVGTGLGGLTDSLNQQTGLFNLANQAGQGQQAADQASIDNAKGMSEYANNNVWQNLQNMFGIVGSNQWGGTSTGESTKESTPSLWSTIGSGLGLAKGLLSDRRFKSDIKRIGMADNGLPIYSYFYTNDPSKTVQIGFMAQDVEKLNPDAVIERDGVKFVNYEMAVA